MATWVDSWFSAARGSSRAVAAAALADGHAVVCVARRQSGSAPAGAALLQADRNAPGALEPLRGERFDAVVDVARMSASWARDAVGVLGPTAAHRTASAVGAPDLTLAPVPAPDLTAADVQPWSGPRSLPLSLPESHRGMTDRDTTPAAAAGLCTRSIGDTARASLAYERALGLDRTRKAGLTAAAEAEVLRRRC